MQGLRFYKQCFKVKTRYGIRDIVDCLVVEISQLYCVAHEEFLMYSSQDGKRLSDQEIESLDLEYERFLVEEQKRSGSEFRNLRLFERGFLTRFRDYLYGDWNTFWLLSEKFPLSEIRLGKQDVPAPCEILISCVDAAYWEVFARDVALLGRLKARFPETEPCVLGDRPF